MVAKKLTDEQKARIRDRRRIRARAFKAKNLELSSVSLTPVGEVLATSFVVVTPELLAPTGDLVVVSLGLSSPSLAPTAGLISFSSVETFVVPVTTLVESVE